MGYWVVVVDDEPLSLTNAKNLLHEKNMRVSCLRSGPEFLTFMEKNTPDLVLLDILMPEMDGFETYRALRQLEDQTNRNQVPVIFLTGEDNRDTERRGLKAGASDFIHKPFDRDVLIKRVENTIANSKTIESLTEEAKHDKLTGFLNKASGTKKVTAICKSNPGAMMIMDLDSFKLVNDLYGHDMGDQILVAFAGIIRRNVRSQDVICRIGGDEFLGYFSGLTGENAVASLEGRLNDQLAAEACTLMGEDHGIPLGISIGVVFSDSEVNDYQVLFQYADNALYEVKRNGKHGYQIYDPSLLTSEKEADLAGDIERLIRIISERGDGNGAMLLGQEAFSWIYRFIDRFSARNGGIYGRVMFFLSSEEKGIIFSEMVSEFGEVLKNTLRKTDIIFQWQQNRYFVLLPLSAEKDADLVMDRIMNKWSESDYNGRIKIRYEISLSRKERYESKEQ